MIVAIGVKNCRLLVNVCRYKTKLSMKKTKRTLNFHQGSFYSCLVRIKGLGVLHAAWAVSHTGLFGLLYFLFCFYFFQKQTSRLSPTFSPIKSLYIFLFSQKQKNGWFAVFLFLVRIKGLAPQWRANSRHRYHAGAVNGGCPPFSRNYLFSLCF